MKPYALILALPALLLTSCLVVEESGSYAPPASNSGSAATQTSGNAQISQNVYNQGRQLGLDDGRKGRSRTPSRYDGMYPAGESDAFTIGYEKGYNEGIR